MREIRENDEKIILSSYATLSANSKGREVYEEECPIRTCFQRDRDRILHSKSFRRLKYKTQVLLLPEGDHYRTRLTHTLEVSQIARTISRALKLNEDLTEAIALGHDLGHTPFGHMGEKVLNDLARKYGLSGFHHAKQSLRVVELLEREGKGLNLTWEVRMGILQHSKGQVDVRTGYSMDTPSTLEAWVVRVSDSVAYINHDLDDAIRAGIISKNNLPQDVFSKMGDSNAKRINTLVIDVIKNSNEKGIYFSPATLDLIETLREFLFTNVYRQANAQIEDSRVSHVIGALFEYALRVKKMSPQSAVDFISGMTDRYALELFHETFVPSPWPMEKPTFSNN
ncbi:MAG: deoxyguanosinetriphosphate triphosphohydrolase [Synergistaceae bacterium]